MRLEVAPRVAVSLALVLVLGAGSPLRNDRWPEFSPDGSHIAFQRSQYGHMDVFVTDVNESAPIPITRGKDDVLSMSPAWFPDGKHLVFTTTDMKGTAGSGYFYEVSSSGGEAQQLSQGAERGRSISPDGTRLLFLTKNWQVASLDIATGRTTVLSEPPKGTLDSDPAWSADGMKIAFGCGYDSTAKVPATGICVMDPDGRNRHMIAHWPGADEWPTWSPDGKQIAFQADSPDFTSGQIIVCKTDEADCRAITQRTGYKVNETPSWSSDGTWIAFQVQTQTGYRVALIHPDGSGFRVLFP